MNILSHLSLFIIVVCACSVLHTCSVCVCVCMCTLTPVWHNAGWKLKDRDDTQMVRLCYPQSVKPAPHIFSKHLTSKL